MGNLNFDIESQSREDGTTHIYHRDDEKRRIIQKLRNSTGMRIEKIIQQISNGSSLQTCFFIYRRK